MQDIENRELYQATIYIVDDNQDLAKALALILQQAGYEVKRYASAIDFLKTYSSAGLSCLLLDVRMPEMSGDQLQAELITQGINIPIVFISGYSDIPVIVDILKKGAIDFLSKPIAKDDLLQAVSKALQQDMKQRKKAEKNEKILTCAHSLTAREKEIMQLIVQGKLNKTIADKLNISTNTVENHRAKIMRKMQVKTIAELVTICLRCNLIHS